MIILGLGSNVGDKLGNLAKAARILNQSVLAAMEMSPVYESAAVLKDNAPGNWDISFLNMAVAGETHLSPSELLKQIKMIEKHLGRQARGTWAPREIDIDILAYGNLCIENDELTIPHVHLYDRPFALVPLADLAPNWQCPRNGTLQGKTAYEVSRAMLDGNCPIAKTDYVIDVREPVVA